MSDIKSIAEAYQNIYEQEESVELTEELLDETFDELVDELIEEGYEEEEAISLLEDATDSYLEEAKVTFGHDTTARRASGAPVGAKRRYGMRKAGEAIKKAKGAVKSAADSAKKKAAGAAAGAAIAGSIAKDEARRAGRKAAHAVTSAPGKAKAAVDRKKQETKRGIKGFIKRQAEKVVKRMSEEIEALKASGKFSEKEISAIEEAMSSYDRNRKRAAERAAARNAARDAGKTGVVPGVGYVSPRRERETYVDSAGTTRHKSGAKMPKD